MTLGYSLMQAQNHLSTSAEIEHKKLNTIDLFSYDNKQKGWKASAKQSEFDVVQYKKLLYAEKIDTLQAKQTKVVVIIDTIINRDNLLHDNVMIDISMVTPLEKVKKKKLSWSLKTNLLYAATLTPNLGLEIGLNSQMSLNITGGYNPWNREGKKDDNDKIVHWMVQPELRYWFCEPANGHFIGVHAIATKYNIAGHNFLYVFDKDYRYEGWGAGAGFTYGYSWMLSKRWAIETYIGVGILHLNFDKTDNRDWCCTKSEHSTKTYFGPTKVGISLIYNIK